MSRREYVTEAAIAITLYVLNVSMWCRAWLRQTWRGGSTSAHCVCVGCEMARALKGGDSDE